MRAAVFGLGQMGEAACYAMTKLGYEVHGIDVSPDRCTAMLNHSEPYCKAVYWGESQEARLAYLTRQKVDIVISCLPYHKNYELAHFCITNELRYCDLGGSVPVSERINALAAKHAKKQVFTDLGLAPGLVNILTEKAFEDFPVLPDDILMAVGGAGVHDRDLFPVCYTCNWSIDGLINEYFDDCVVLEDRKLVKKPGMSDPILLTTYLGVKEYNEILAFNTSGGIGSTAELMQKRGVKNCRYVTIRQREHYLFLRYLIDTLKLDRDQIKDVLEKSCKNRYASQYNQDKVSIAIRLSKDDLIMHRDWFAYQDDNEKFSAMQQYTAYTLASIADLLVKDIVKPIVPTYEDVAKNFDIFHSTMKQLGIHFDYTEDDE